MVPQQVKSYSTKQKIQRGYNLIRGDSLPSSHNFTQSLSHSVSQSVTFLLISLIKATCQSYANNMTCICKLYACSMPLICQSYESHMQLIQKSYASQMKVIQHYMLGDSSQIPLTCQFFAKLTSVTFNLHASHVIFICQSHSCHMLVTYHPHDCHMLDKCICLLFASPI